MAELRVLEPPAVATKPRITYMASYPPRECGIATFTKDLVDAVDRTFPGHPAKIIALNESQATYQYGQEVKVAVTVDDPESYREAADYVNRSRTDLLCIQHEYGLFGGQHGENIFTFLDALRKPLAITLHTVLPRPDDHLREVTREIVSRADRTVVLAKKALDILAEDYGISAPSVRYVPHGVPNVRKLPSTSFKSILGLEGRFTVSTFGLINPGKGIEYAIKALPEVVKKYPSVLYLVLGETHPGVRKNEGENYRNCLHDLVSELGLKKHVKFNNRYLTHNEIVSYLMATNIYLVPYLNPNQIASGTLAYAVGAGRAVVSTPFIYATELLEDGRGILVPFRDSDAIAEALDGLIGDAAGRSSMAMAAYAYGRNMTWHSVAREYMQLFGDLVGRPTPMPMASNNSRALAL
ncbi:MAG TPA: glycosyltransferase family 4 protein [Chloroflexota bacterium]|nr:glycosyltransferase family 4 protein [Chloroflexota bacterium]HEX2988015.1 glycosyltransferase family 4 protein [Chloroflexota bacterium]